MCVPVLSIKPALLPADLVACRDLFEAYAQSLEIDLGYQNFQDELDQLPGQYAPPTGVLLLARNDLGLPIGCVALRATPTHGCCEMKRLFVAQASRRLGLGQQLITTLVNYARPLGYQRMVLDTLPSMTNAMRLYEQNGFEPITPYYDTPIRDTRFYGRFL